MIQTVGCNRFKDGICAFKVHQKTVSYLLVNFNRYAMDCIYHSEHTVLQHGVNNWDSKHAEGEVKRSIYCRLFISSYHRIILRYLRQMPSLHILNHLSKSIQEIPGSEF